MFSEWQQEVFNSGPLWGHNFNPSACFFCGEDGLRGSGVSEHQPGWWWNSGRTWGRHCREDVRVERKSLGWDVKLFQLFLVGVGVLFLCFYYLLLLLFFVVVVAVAALLLVTCMPVWYAEVYIFDFCILHCYIYTSSMLVYYIIYLTIYYINPGIYLVWPLKSGCNILFSVER